MGELGGGKRVEDRLKSASPVAVIAAFGAGLLRSYLVRHSFGGGGRGVQANGDYTQPARRRSKGWPHTHTLSLFCVREEICL